MGCEKTKKLHSLHSNRFLGNQKVSILKTNFVYCVAILRKKPQELSFKKLLLTHNDISTSTQNKIRVLKSLPEQTSVVQPHWFYLQK